MRRSPGFMDKIGHGRIAWLAAFHDIGKDEHNPHCHLIFRDADIETGRKVVGTTTSAKDVREAEEHGWRVPPRMTTKDLRVAWCEHLNAEMERHGLEARFDQRTLKAQGIDREPQIHVGPKAMSMADKDRSFESRDRQRGGHANVYSLLDAGSRAEHNKRIIAGQPSTRRPEDERTCPQFNWPPGPEGLEKRQLRERQAADRKSMYQDQKRDRAALREAHDAQKLEHQRWGRAHYAAARERAFQEVKVQNADRWKDIRRIKEAAEREEAAQALKIESKATYAELPNGRSTAHGRQRRRRGKSSSSPRSRNARSCSPATPKRSPRLSRQQIAERHRAA